jgi:hypothetical protein
MAELMDAEVAELVGSKGRHDPARTATRHGTEPGSVTLGGRRVSMCRPRVRTVGEDDHSARRCRSSRTRRSRRPDLLAEQVVARMLAGISTRRYPVALEPVGEQVEQAASSTSKSAVSRRFVTATAERLAELSARPLGDQRWIWPRVGWTRPAGWLFAVDGGKAINDVYGSLAVTQRCRRHYEERRIMWMLACASDVCPVQEHLAS